MSTSPAALQLAAAGAAVEHPPAEPLLRPRQRPAGPPQAVPRPAAGCSASPRCGRWGSSAAAPARTCTHTALHALAAPDEGQNGTLREAPAAAVPAEGAVPVPGCAVLFHEVSCPAEGTAQRDAAVSSDGNHRVTDQLQHCPRQAGPGVPLCGRTPEAVQVEDVAAGQLLVAPRSGQVLAADDAHAIAARQVLSLRILQAPPCSPPGPRRRRCTLSLPAAASSWHAPCACWTGPPRVQLESEHSSRPSAGRTHGEALVHVGGHAAVAQEGGHPVAEVAEGPVQVPHLRLASFSPERSELAGSARSCASRAAVSAGWGAPGAGAGRSG